MRDPAPWQKRYDMMWLMAILLGVIGQYLFVGRALGVSVLLFTVLFYGYFFYAARGRMGGFDRWRGQSKTGRLLFVPIAMLALAYALFANELFRFLNSIALILLIVGQTMLLTRGGSEPWYRPKFLAELLQQWFVAPFAHLSVPFSMTAGWLKFREDNSKTKSDLRKIMLGLLLAAPLLLVVVILLASADGIFEFWLNKIPSLLDGGSAGEGFLRFFAAAGLALYLFCYVWGLLFKRESRSAAAQPSVAGSQVWPAAERQPDQDRTTFDPLVAATVLICVNAVYVLFAAIQFTYLFGAADGLLPDGTAYAEYARRGFAELVAVALLNIGILLIGLHFIEKGSSLMERLRQALLTVLMGCTLVMLISAYSRLSLYEEAYGYTQLRLLVHGFMVFLGVLMLVAVVRIWYRWFSLAKVYIAIGVAAYVIMNYINLDARIAEGNIARYEATGKIDIGYLGTLSADAGPALERLLREHPELDGVDSILAQMKGQAKERSHWQSWNLAIERMKNR
ncbi:DUF4173 domain-containing protein [Paenibacillus nanensis]|uniref:DUF4173 domain-containing protein n=1 Tax=Paenibacillus nanensis TaxID=393251 RepID=A0A3A1UQV2_9BACL|nr:DUF4173 domain-containing protein [Paenibacillus nanensis]RIX49352.1 DUF4173 domain-containing protein [Paenibacillus nanensis]